MVLASITQPGSSNAMVWGRQNFMILSLIVSPFHAR